VPVALVAVAGALLAGPATVRAQPVLRRSEAPFSAVQLAVHSGTRTPAQAFAIEAAGGVAGSLIGFGVVLLGDDDCDVEDLGCHLERAFLGIALGTLGSAAGTYLAGRAFDTRPSGAGATLGAVVGAAAGIGAWHLFTEELDLVNRTEAAVVVYALTQGVMAALGSRLLRSLQ
jgi:phosphate/sulfate permease